MSVEICDVVVDLSVEFVYMRVSGEVEQGASRLSMSCLMISVRLDVMLGMWCFAEKLRILRNCDSSMLQEENNSYSKRVKNSSASRVNESQSVILRLVKV